MFLRRETMSPPTGFVLELSLNTAILRALCRAARGGWGPLGTAAQRHRNFAGGDRLQCAHDLSALHGGFVLEFFRSLRACRRTLSGHSAWPDYGGGPAAKIVERPAGQSQYRGAGGKRSGLGQYGDDRRDVVSAGRHA